MSKWIEVNIPVAADERTTLLLEVVDPLVHGQLGEQIETWFYFWEPELRLRLGWRDPAEAERGRTELIQFLEQAKTEGKLGEWYEGRHGKRGEVYDGEADFYGAEVWELTSKDWMSGSELALAILRFEAQGVLTQPPHLHWGRRVHLFSNQLALSEIALCLVQAHGYLEASATDPRVIEMRAAIENFLAPESSSGR